MTEEELDPILIQVTVPLPVPMIYKAMVEPAQLGAWLAEEARVAPALGGEFYLRFGSPTPFESAGRILKLTTDVDLGFSWLGPPEFAAIMNAPTPRTNVYLRLQESPEGVDVTLEHAGWGSGEPWEEARSWHFHFWDEHLQRFKDYLIKTAYG